MSQSCAKIKGISSGVEFQNNLFMHSKNKTPMTSAERKHVVKVMALPCSLCDASGPSDAHEIEQGNWWCSVALCRSCHTGTNGWHGTKAMWRIKKLNELDALAITLRRLFVGV